MEVTLEGRKRQPGSKPNALRREGQIPANLYGHKGTEAIHLTVDAKSVELLLKKATVNNTVIRLNIPDEPWQGRTLLREVQTHAWKGFPYHLSFFAIASQDSLQVVVPLNYVGEAVGVKQDGGVLDTTLTELQMECTPDSIPDSIEINVSEMNIGDTLYLKDIILPSGAQALGDPDLAVVSVLQPRVSETATETTEDPLEGIQYGLEAEGEVEGETAEAATETETAAE
ncbi:MAG: 50S ribosomal protein L25/general stress protein Ctc [Desertifilum sp. SIO1I2]|nr:50S ribosomal protein L25/general stress protein Ctc [Desertifilum sp. SIO1I2]